MSKQFMQRETNRLLREMRQKKERMGRRARMGRIQGDVIGPSLPSSISAMPDQWFDLSDGPTWANQAGGNWSLTETGTIPVSSGGGPGGQDVAQIDLGNYFNGGFVGAASIATWSVSLWFKASSFDVLTTAAMHGSQPGDRRKWLLRVITGGTLEFVFYDGAGVLGNLSHAGIELDRWYHAMASIDPAGENVLYLDGEEVDRINGLTPGAQEELTMQLAVATAGNGLTNPSYQWRGALGMLGVAQNKLWTADDAKYLHNAGAGKQFGDLVAPASFVNLTSGEEGFLIGYRPFDHPTNSFGSLIPDSIGGQRVFQFTANTSGAVVQLRFFNDAKLNDADSIWMFFPNEDPIRLDWVDVRYEVTSERIKDAAVGQLGNSVRVGVAPE